jgi:hypothetical protein
MNKLLPLFALLLMFASCGSHKKAVKTTDQPTDTLQKVTNSLDRVRMEMAAAAPTYTWLRSKGQVEYEKKDQKLNARFSFKLRRDSLVWSSINVMIEAARGMATVDSAYILNRISKEYAILPVAGLESILGIPGLNLTAVQNLMLAYPPFGIASDATMKPDNTGYLIERKTATFAESFHINAATMHLDSYHFEKNASQQIDVKYSDFTAAGSMQLPKKIEFSVASPDKILITLNIAEYNLLETDEAPFIIPPGYTRIH